jgi:hypothetical protein
VGAAVLFVHRPGEIGGGSVGWMISTSEESQFHDYV